MQALVVHELTHALSQQHFPEFRFGAAGRVVTFQASEGEAEIVEYRFLLTRSEADHIAYQQFLERGGFAPEDAPSSAIGDILYTSRPGLINMLGTDLIGDLWDSGGTQAVDDFFRNPPGDIVNLHEWLNGGTRKPHVHFATTSGLETWVQSQLPLDALRYGTYPQGRVGWLEAFLRAFPPEVALIAAQAYRSETTQLYSVEDQVCFVAVFPPDTGRSFVTAMQIWTDQIGTRHWTVGEEGLEVTSCDPGADASVPLLPTMGAEAMLTDVLKAERWASLNGLERSVGTCIAMAFLGESEYEMGTPRWLLGPPSDSEQATEPCMSGAA